MSTSLPPPLPSPFQPPAVLQPSCSYPHLDGTQCGGDLPAADWSGEGATGPLSLSRCYCATLDSEGTLHRHLWAGQGLGPGPTLLLSASKVRRGRAYTLCIQCIYTCVGLYIVLHMLSIRMCMCVLQYICIHSVCVAKCSVFTGYVCIHTYICTQYYNYWNYWKLH